MFVFRRKALVAAAILLTAAILAPLCRAEPLTNVAALAKALLAADRDDERFDFTATVTCRIPTETRTSFTTLTDDSGDVCVSLPLECVCTCGDTIRISGTTYRQPNGGLLACASKSTRLAHASAPKPRHVSIREVTSGHEDWRFVRIRGTLRSVLTSETNANWELLTIVAENALLRVSVPRNGTDHAEFEKLIGRKLEIEGFSNPRDTSPRAYLGRIFQCPGLGSIHPVAATAPDPFNVPEAVSLRFLSAAEISASNQVREKGRVLAVWDGTHAILRSASGRVFTAEFASTPPTVGSTIEAVGFPETDCFYITLTHARWRKSELDLPPETPAEDVTPADILTGRRREPPARAFFHGKAIRLKGRVHAPGPMETRPGQLLLEDGGTIFPVTLTTSNVQPSTFNLPDGSLVELTGVCILETDDWNPARAFPRIRGFRIVVNRPDGIRLIAAPSWWTPGRFTAVICVLLVLLAGILAWNTALRRLAARKGRELFDEHLGRAKADLRTQERTRLAVELHDTLAQNLTGVSMELEAARDLRGDAPAPMLAHLDIAAKALKSSREELRNCLWDLRSQALEEPDMNQAILRTLQPHVNESHLAVRFHVPRERLSDNTAHTLLRIIRELVINAIRHGGATTVKVAGTLDGDRLLCSVSDDGLGFDPDTAPGILQGHFGLQGIRERLNELGGTFTLTSSPGHGTRAEVSLVLSP